LNFFVMRKCRCKSPTYISISIYEYSYHFSMFLVKMKDYLMYYLLILGDLIPRFKDCTIKIKLRAG
jgi:hypothetical protein